MTLIEQVYAITERLKGDGWADLLMAVAKLNIDQPSAAKLGEELARPLDDIVYDVPGFEDFYRGAAQGITPAVPYASLLYHALASPGVQGTDEITLTDYPTLAEIETVENYIFAAAKRSFDELELMAGSDQLGIVVFACQYRPATDTVHRHYADLCFSRTGLSRVGNTGPIYDSAMRGFVPWRGGDPENPTMGDDGKHVIRVMPCRYAAYVAIRLQGDEGRLGAFGPMNKNFLQDHHPDVIDYNPIGPDDPPDDDELDFWVPVHKLFGGTECLRGLDLSVELTANHVNNKLQRIQEFLAGLSINVGWGGLDTTQSPFRVTNDLAEFSTVENWGSNLLIPEPQNRLAVAANAPNTANLLGLGVPIDYEDKIVNAYQVKFGADSYGWLSSSMSIPSIETVKEAHRAPEYINVRHKLEANNRSENLNDEDDLMAILEAGGFQAVTYGDTTADGWIGVTVPQLNNRISRQHFIAAYSLITAPDFLPYVHQRQLMEWTSQYFKNAKDWPRAWERLPYALSEDRIAPNVMLASSGFSLDDRTGTSIVSMPADLTVTQAQLVRYAIKRGDNLPDAAAGTYAPGWDVSYDVDDVDDKAFLVSHGLGSPFVEDAKICAALGSFWPGVAPDTTRNFPPRANWASNIFWRTVAPLTDKELGIGGGWAWDGIAPRAITSDNRKIRYTKLEYADYVDSALGAPDPEANPLGLFSIALLQKIGLDEYIHRALAMYRTYWALGVTNANSEKWAAAAGKWAVVSFNDVKVDDDAFLAALQEASVDAKDVVGPVFHFRMYKPGTGRDVVDDFKLIEYDLTHDTLVYVYTNGAVKKPTDGGAWAEVAVP